MRVAWSILLLMISFVSFAQGDIPIVHLTEDSLSKFLLKGWRYHAGDDEAWAAPGFNDSGWQVANIALSKKELRRLDFNGVGWFRLHMDIDSGLVGKQLALAIKQWGASDIYLDGQKLVGYGEIGPDHQHSLYFNPHNKPATFVFDTAGTHMLAVRYAKFDAKHTVDKYGAKMVGVLLRISTAEEAIDDYKANLLVVGVVFLTFFSLFLALAFVHFLLWLYYRADKSNLYFSFFCMALSFVAIAYYLPITASNPQLSVRSPSMLLISCLLIFLSLSALSHYLFSKKKTLFRVLAFLTFAAIVVISVAPSIAGYTGILIMTLILDSTIVTGKAMYYKKPGAGIVGVGVFAFTAFLVLSVVLLSVGVNLDVADDGTGKLFAILCVLAILSTPISMSVYLARNFAHMNKSLQEQLLQVQQLSEKTRAQELEKQHMLENRKEELEREVAIRTEQLARQHQELKEEKHKSDELLRNILPEEIAEELKNDGTSKARHFDQVTVIFTDFVDFTKAGERMTPQELVDELHNCFKAFDEIISRYRIEKIKTIGDAYLAVCGLPVADSNHAQNVVKAALDIRQFMDERRKQVPDKAFGIRIGIHSGPVVAGIVGVKKFAYDIWGDTVNTAARMESSSEQGKINISHTTYELVKNQFDCTFRGEITAKNKGELRMYFVESEPGNT